MRKVSLLVNPLAGKGKAVSIAKEILDLSTELNIQIDLLTPRERNQVREVVLHSLDSGTDRIIALGGDGLVNQVANLLAGSETALGIIPSGTGNDFARSLRLNSGELYEKLKIALSPALPIDLIKCGSHLVATSVICGFPAYVNKRSNQLRFPKGSSSYTVATLMELPKMRHTSYQLKLKDKTIEIKAAAIIVANACFFGGGMKICPDADLSDGLLDVCIIGDVSKSDLMGSFLKIRTGDHLDHPKVSVFKTSQIEIIGEGILRGDGEELDDLPVNITVQEGALKVAGGNCHPHGRG